MIEGALAMMHMESSDLTTHIYQDCISSSSVAPDPLGAIFKEPRVQMEIKAWIGFWTMMGYQVGQEVGGGREYT